MSMLCGVGMVLDDGKDLFEVVNVTEEGPAGRSGLIQPGDVLKGVDGIQVSICCEARASTRTQPHAAPACAFRACVRYLSLRSCSGIG